MIYASWSQNCAQTSHELPKFTRHITNQTWRQANTSFPIGYFVTIGNPTFDDPFDRFFYLNQPLNLFKCFILYFLLGKNMQPKVEWPLL